MAFCISKIYSDRKSTGAGSNARVARRTQDRVGRPGDLGEIESQEYHSDRTCVGVCPLQRLPLQKGPDLFNGCGVFAESLMLFASSINLFSQIAGRPYAGSSVEAVSTGVPAPAFLQIWENKLIELANNISDSANTPQPLKRSGPFCSGNRWSGQTSNARAITMVFLADFDVTQITWAPTTILRSTSNSRIGAGACTLSIEYIFEMQKAMVVETPEVGHATYLFRKPASIDAFLSRYIAVSKQDIRQNKQILQNSSVLSGGFCMVKSPHMAERAQEISRGANEHTQHQSASASADLFH